MLWIITQNKKSLINVKEVTVKGKYIEGVAGRYFFSEWSRPLGKYDSSERAAEVLGQLHAAIENEAGSNVTFIMPEK